MAQNQVTGRDFIIFGLQAWDIPIGSNCKNIARQIASSNRVLYINRPLDRISYLKKNKDVQTINRIKSIKKGEDILTEVHENLWVYNPGRILESINMLPPGIVYDFFNKMNNKLLAGEIRDVAARLSFKDPILLVDNDFFNSLYLKEYLNPQLFIFYIRDYLRSQKYFEKHGKKSEPAVMHKADGVAANSLYLAQYALQFNKNAVDIGQGCEVENFINAPGYIPGDIAPISCPIIGYCGALTSARLDIKLIESIALQKKDWSIVLVGPCDQVFEQCALKNMPNVYFTGPKPPAELPAYIHSFDVCINPQLLNQMTIGNYPRKVDEYLAAGKPVVATKTDTMLSFGSTVFLCENAEQYVSAIEEALLSKEDASKKEERKKMALSHTWEASVEKLYSLINKVSNGK